MTNRAAVLKIPQRPQRATQGFVANVTWAARHPSATLIEIAWRWVFGLPLLLVSARVFGRVLAAVPWRSTGVQNVSANQMLTDPMGAAVAFGTFGAMVLPELLKAARWLAPAALVAWVVLSSLGRMLVLRRMDAALRPRLATMLGLQAARVLLSVLVALVWWFGVQALAAKTIADPIAAGGEPRIMVYTGGGIALTLGLFVLAGAVSWVFAAAPIVAMRDGAGVWASLRGAAMANGVRGGMAEINLVLSVVKIMLIVLAMAFSAFPLPFTSVITDEYILYWTALIALLYFAGSDFFHVTRLHAFLQLLARIPERRELTQRGSAASE